MPSILIIEDNSLFSKTLAHVCEQETWSFSLAGDLRSAYDLLSTKVFDLLIVDRHLPDGDGLELVEWLRNEALATRLLILTGKSQPIERVKGYVYGADDYVIKPCDLEELRWRIKRLLEKYRYVLGDQVRVKDISLEKASGKLHIKNKIYTLTKTETSIMECFLLHPRQVLQKQQLIQYVWGVRDKAPTEDSLDVYIRRLRQKLVSSGGVIKTVRGFGFSLEDVFSE